MSAWEASGRPPPPPDCIKYERIRRSAREFRTPVLVETGTFRGDAIFALRRDFEEIHSIELAPELHATASRTLGHLRHLHLHLGDSATELARVAGRLTQPALFWLDGHYCAGPSARGEQDTPIVQELTLLFDRPRGENGIMIDDARLFVGENGYPSLDQVRAMAAARRPGAAFAVENDIITLHPV